MFDLAGKVAIVTGSSRGIGRAAVEALARAGARVVVSSRKPEAIEPVAAAIRAAGGEAVAIPCNVGREDQLQGLVDETRKRFGRIDVLVGNAAVNPYFGSLEGLTREPFDKTMATNVWSNLVLARLVMPDMAERREGAIIIVSSIAGLKGTGSLGAYAISKAADFQLARNLAVEWGGTTSASTASPRAWCGPISRVPCGRTRRCWPATCGNARSAASARSRTLPARWCSWRRMPRAS